MSASFEGLVSYVTSCMDDSGCEPWEMDITIDEAEKVIEHIVRNRLFDESLELLRICKFPVVRSCPDGTARLLKVACDTMDARLLEFFAYDCYEDIDWPREQNIPDPDDVLYAICNTDKVEVVASIDIQDWRAALEWEPDGKYKGVDAYWSACIRYRIAKKDWMRAWDDLRHALMGFPADQTTTLRQYHRWNKHWSSTDVRENRTMFCSDLSICGRLAQNLFEEMRQHKMLPDEFRGYLQQGVPGMLEASVLQFRQRTECDAVLAIAAWAKSKKSEKRQKRIKKRMNPNS